MFWTNIIDRIRPNGRLFEEPMEDPMDLNGGGADDDDQENNVQYDQQQHYGQFHKSSTTTVGSRSVMLNERNDGGGHQVVRPDLKSRTNHNINSNGNANDNRRIDSDQLDFHLRSIMKVRRTLVLRQRLKLIQRQKRCSRNIMLMLILYILIGLSNTPGKILSQQMAGCCAGAKHGRHGAKANYDPSIMDHKHGMNQDSPPFPTSSESSSAMYNSYRSPLNPELLFSYTSSSSSSTLPWSMINKSSLDQDGYRTKSKQQEQSNRQQRSAANRFAGQDHHNANNDDDDVFGEFGSFQSSPSSSPIPMFDSNEYNFDYQWTSVSSVAHTPTDIYHEDMAGRLNYPIAQTTPTNSYSNEKKAGEAIVTTMLTDIKVTPVVLIVENHTIGSSANSGTMGTTTGPPAVLIGPNSTDEELRIKLMNRLKNLTLVDVFIVIVGGSLSISTILGNVLVMVAFKIDRNLQTISNYFLLSLAVADFLIGCISMPLSLIYIIARGWPLGPIACDIWLAIDYLNSNASVLNLLLISFDRYLSVTRPLTYRAKRTTRRACIFIAFAWIISALLWPPWIFAWPSIEGRRTVPTYQCYIPFLESNIWVTTITAIMAFWLPVTLMCVLYWLIWRETENRYRELTSLVVISPATTTQPTTTSTNRSATGNNTNTNPTSSNVGHIKKNAKNEKKMIRKSRSIDKQRNKQTPSSSIKSKMPPNHLPNCPRSLQKQLLQEQRQQQQPQSQQPQTAPKQPQGQKVRMLVGFPFGPTKTKSLTQKQELEMTTSSHSSSGAAAAMPAAGTSGRSNRPSSKLASSGRQTSSSTGETTPKIFSTHDYDGEVGLEEARHQLTSRITAGVGVGASDVICLTSPTLRERRFSIQIDGQDEPNPNENGPADQAAAVAIEPTVAIEQPQSVYQRFRNWFGGKQPNKAQESSTKADCDDAAVDETNVNEVSAQQPGPSTALLQNAAPECPGCEYRLKRLRAKRRKQFQMQKQQSRDQSRDSDGKNGKKPARKVSRQATQEDQPGCSKQGKQVNYQIHELESTGGNQENKADTSSIYTIVIKLDNPAATANDSQSPSTSKTTEVKSAGKSGDGNNEDIRMIDDDGQTVDGGQGGEQQPEEDFSDVESAIDYCMDSDVEDFDEDLGDSDEDFDDEELDHDSDNSGDKSDDSDDEDDDSESIKIKNCCAFMKCCHRKNNNVERSGPTQATSAACANADAGGQGNGNNNGNRQQPQSTSASATAASSSSAFTRVRATIQPKSERKAAKTLSAILLAFIVTWTPYNVLVFVKTFSPGSVDSDGLWWQFAYYLCYINSTLNPLLYALCNANFRRTYIRILTCRFRRGNHPTPASATAAAVHHARRREQLRERERNEQQRQAQQLRSTTLDDNNGDNPPTGHHRHQPPTPAPAPAQAEQAQQSTVAQPTQEASSSTVAIQIEQIAASTNHADGASTMVPPTMTTTLTTTTATNQNNGQ